MTPKKNFRSAGPPRSSSLSRDECLPGSKKLHNGESSFTNGTFGRAQMALKLNSADRVALAGRFSDESGKKNATSHGCENTLGYRHFDGGYTFTKNAKMRPMGGSGTARSRYLDADLDALRNNPLRKAEPVGTHWEAPSPCNRQAQGTLDFGWRNARSTEQQNRVITLYKTVWLR